LIYANNFFIFPAKMTCRCESFQTIWKLNSCSFIIFSCNSSLMYAADRNSLFEGIPGILFNLFMAELQLTVILINTHYNHINIVSNFGVFVRVIKTLQPA